MSYATKEQLKDIMSDAADKVSRGLSESESLLRDTVGFTSKNLLKNKATTQTKNGLTFTVNGDGSITVNGTATSSESVYLNSEFKIPSGKYILSGGNNTSDNLMIVLSAWNNGSYVKNIDAANNGSYKTITVDYNGYANVRNSIWFRSGTVVNNLTLYPMLRRADIIDDTYEPYHESVETKFEEEVRGVNLLEVTAGSITKNGITFTVNNDGSITANGTATASSDLQITNTHYFPKVGSYILSGCPSGGGGNSYIIGLREYSQPWYYTIDSGNGASRTVNDASIPFTIYVEVKSGVTVNNLTFKPMLRKADIDDSTYRPYNNTAIKNQIKDIHNVLGVKNLIPYPYENRTVTSQGVTYTNNSDGTVTVNGTSTATGEERLTGRSVKDKLHQLYEPGDYILSFGQDLTGSGLTLGLGTTKNNTYTNIIDNVVKDNTKVTITTSMSDEAVDGKIPVAVYIRHESGKTFNNLVIKPMLRLASIEDDTYEPYAMTNRQITKVLNVNSDAIPSYIATSLPFRFKDITDEFYNGNLRTEIAAGNFANVRVGDYILGKSTGTKYFVADMDGRLGKGDNTNNTNYPAYGTHHLNLMLFKVTNSKVTKLWNGWGYTDKTWKVSDNDRNRCPWNAATDADPTATDAVGVNNTNITRSYNGTNMSGYMGSFIRERIDAILLPQCFQADFGEANVLKYREINGKTVNTEVAAPGVTSWKGCTTDWGWVDRYLDLPSEVELYGARIFSGAMDVGTQCEQLPLFKHSHIHDSFPRMDIWIKGVASSSSAARRDTNGLLSANIASVAIWACPLACVK